MKELLFLIVLDPCLAHAGEITGKWSGILTVKGIDHGLYFDLLTKI